ncbi:EamA family transporter RarD [Demequina sp. B12]|uniref:EamA family transporter RarD n=1 Tax=Demequina sp. B12 TaxID=2992757 RepID=UPI00237B3B2A|nr:EamA family transporter RarD [Demequina sp. B12]MDE0572375.1 EamA family transporter RarD [Demequina sp. B12]
MNTPLSSSGLAFGASAYVIWGLFPLLLTELAPANALEVTAQRSVWSLVVCALLLTVMNGWQRMAAVVRNRRTLLMLGASASVIVINWLVYVFAVETGHVSSASLGYYINPLVLVALGVVFLGERLRRAQVVALGIALVAIVVIGAGLGEFPWISLVLAGSFGCYGLLKKQVGRDVDALTGLTVETLLLAPVALAGLALMSNAGGITFGQRGEPGLGLTHDLLLVSTGIVTAGSLLLFAAGARRLPLFVTGLLQYIAPTMMFALAVTYFGEPMPWTRWAGFSLVWVALVVLTVDGWRSRARKPQAVVQPAEPV